MKLSYNWLKNYVDFDWGHEETADRLTMTGLEVEGIEKYESIQGGLEGVVVGHVLEVIPHPNADKLRITTVDVGAEEPLTIVCGAPNVAQGQKVPVGLVGTTLYPSEGEPFTLKKAKIRGQQSMGMICAEDELGLGEGHDGIMVLDESLVPGTPAAEVFDIEIDHVFEVGLTANRPDGASHFGASRDIAAVLRTKSKLPDMPFEGGEPSANNPFTIELPEPDKCPRYAGIYISGVEVKESPEWIQNRLKAIGLRPKNNVVDITNYVLHELGHPLHAFDADQLAGNKIVVKTLDTDQKYTTLDEEERELRANVDLMICDGEKPVAIAGIMGGLGSSVNENTKNIFLESAWFDPGTIRKSAKHFGLKTDASYRFERGTDPHMVLVAARRAASLIQQLAGGTVSVVIDNQQRDFPPFQVAFDLPKANQLMGREFTQAEVTEILEALEIKVASVDGDVLQLEVPQYRVDVQRPQDVMEEILRIYGYNNIEISAEAVFQTGHENITTEWNVQQKYYDYLAGSGWRELVTNSLVAARHQTETSVNLVNSLSEEMAVMRENMLISGIEIVEYNHNRKQFDLRLFDPGRIFHLIDGEYVEKDQVAFFLTGNTAPPHWDGTHKANFFALKTEFERMAKWFRLDLEADELNDPLWEYGLELKKGNTSVAKFGKAAGSVTKDRNIRGELFWGTFDWKPVLKHWRKQQVLFKEAPKFPSTERDISMIVPDEVRYESIRKAIEKASPKLIKSVNITDVYKGESIGEGKKSYLLNVVLQDESKTINDKTADKLMARVFSILEKDMGVEIRK